MGSSKEHTEIWVVFDTSVVCTPSIGRFLPEACTRLIEQTSRTPDATVRWYLPETVLEERRYQMRMAAHSELHSATRLSRLLGTVPPTKLDIEQAVDSLIEHNMADLNLVPAALDPGLVDWKALIDASVSREGIFAHPDEKGFRDAIIMETALQLLGRAKGHVCKVVLVTNDNGMRACLQQRTSGDPRAQVLQSLEDLSSFFSSLRSELPTERLESLLPKATAFFFAKEPSTGVRTGAYFDLRVKEGISAKFGKELAELPPGMQRRSDIWVIEKASYRRNEGQRLFWCTNVRVEAQAFAEASTEAGSCAVDSSSPALGGAASWLPSRCAPNQYAESGVAFANATGMAQGAAIADIPIWARRVMRIGEFYQPPVWGRTTFAVEWSADVDDADHFSNGTIDDIKYLGSAWD